MPYPLLIPTLQYNSQIVQDILELEKLKVRRLSGTIHPAIFFEVKALFHLLESLGSARIEGNRTTIDDLVDSVVRGERDTTEQLREIANIEDAMSWIEDVFRREPQRRIDVAFILELHRLTVKNLRSPQEGGEGDVKPGTFRLGRVRISGASFIPPDGNEMPVLVDELVEFINEPQNALFDLLRAAIAHHRFAYVHPFRNGNGRVVRLLTYAMMVRSGYRVDDGRIINPTAVFCHDRTAYMTALAKADGGTEKDLLDWCSFVLSGLRRELTMVNNLLDKSVLIPQILVPALQESRTREIISQIEFRVLLDVLEHQVANAAVIQRRFPGKSASAVSQTIARFKQRGLITAYPNANSRRYIVNFTGALLFRPLINALDAAGYLPSLRG